MYKPQTMRLRKYLFVLALALLTLIPVFSVGAQSPEDVVITTFPKDYQLYPRDASNKGTIEVAGTVNSSDLHRAALVIKDSSGARLSTQVQTLTFVDGSADFSISGEIDAITDNHEVILQFRSNSTGTWSNFATADNIVAGDVFVIQGQSNAVAGMYTSEGYTGNESEPAVLTSASAQNDFVRTYGSSTGDSSVLQLDDNWYIADGDGFNDAGTIGQWGLKMADTLVDDHGVPIAIINGAFGGEEISFFQRDDADPANLDTNYGRLLYRMENSGLKDDITGIFWYQGESDEGDVELHLAGFDEIYSDWKADYPSATDYYVFQIADFCFGDNLSLREAQRRLPDAYSDVTVISTNAIKGHRSDCHYWWQDGYETLGANAARLIASDHYGAAAADAGSPDLVRAYFSDASRTQVVLQLENVDGGLNFDDFRSTTGNTALYRFSFSSDLNEAISIQNFTIDEANSTITFDIQIGWDGVPIPPAGNVTVNFEGDQWLKMGTQEADEDNVTNSNGHGLLTFEAKVFSSADAPEAQVYATGALQGTLVDGKFAVDFKGDRSSDPNGDIVEYKWDFDSDGEIDSYGENKWWEFTESGTYNVSLTVEDSAGNVDVATATVLVFADTSNACVQHGLNYERFDGISGTTVNDLINANVWNSPSSHSYITDFEIPANVGDEYGARVRGYIVPPITGDYEFWVASDDESKVWIYSLEDKDAPGFTVPDITSTIALTPVTYIEYFSSPERQFETADSPWNGSQWTAGIEFAAYEVFTKTLEVGKQYYVEALFKEGTAGDHMSLGWLLPGAKNFSLITNDNLCVATTDLPLAPLPVLGTNATSGEAPFTVFFDSSQSTDSDGTIGNVAWSYGDGNVSNEVSPAYEYSTPGTYYAVLSVTDNDGFTNHAVQQINVLEPDCSVDGNGILFERFDNVGGRLISDMLADDTYLSGVASHKSRLNAFEIPANIGDEYAVRMRGYIVPDTSGIHTFRVAGDDQTVVFLSTDDNPANMAPIMAVTNYTDTLTFDSVNGIPGDQGWTDERDWLNAEVKYVHQESAGISLVAGERYYVEVLYKEDLFGDHMSVAWQEPNETTFDLVLCNNLEPFNTAVHNLDIEVTASQTTVPESGAWIEYEVVLTNSGSAELSTDPIKINSIVDSKHGEVASDADGWSAAFVENTCWWWMPELYVGQSWRCTYTQWVTGAAEAHTVTVNGTTVSGKAISESYEVDHQTSVGPGVKNTNAWASDGVEVIQQFTQLVDSDGEMDLSFDVTEADVRDMDGILIGDYDFDGVCDMWQTWWLRNCIALSTSEVMDVLDDDSSSDMRVRMLRSMTATWLNIAAGNAYECADMQTAVNLGLIWMNDYGNPFDGGSPITSTSSLWTQIEYAQVWYDWYNDTGGNFCADAVAGGSSACGTVAQEAEIAAEDRPAPLSGDSIYGNRLEVVSDSDANAGAYLQGKTNYGNQWRMSSRWSNGSRQYYSSHYAEYCVYIPADGYYSIDAWVRSPLGGSDNSFFVQFNDGGYALWDTSTDRNDFAYSFVSHRNWGSWNKVYWNLTEGEHTLKFHLRENGTQLDRFEVKAYSARNTPDNVLDAGTPVGNEYFSTGEASNSDAHYMYQWLVDGNNVATSRSGSSHSGDFAVAMAGFLTDVEGVTEQDSVDVSGAVGYIEGSADIAEDTDSIVHVAGVTNFNPNVVPTSVAMSNSDVATGSVVLTLVITMMSVVTLGALVLRKRTN